MVVVNVAKFSKIYLPPIRPPIRRRSHGAGAFYLENNTMLVEISLTKNQKAIIDAEDYRRIWEHSWSAIKGRSTWYARAWINGKDTYLHRFITTAPSDVLIDHVNGNGLDNRKNNLRFCTSSQNHANGNFRGGKSKYKGVHWHSGPKKIKRWVAQIKRDGKNTHLDIITPKKRPQKPTIIKP